MKTTKAKFENMLFKMNNEETLGLRKYDEVQYQENGEFKVVRLHLYYNDNGHCGTWAKGNGVIHNRCFEA